MLGLDRDVEAELGMTRSSGSKLSAACSSACRRNVGAGQPGNGSADPGQTLSGIIDRLAAAGGVNGQVLAGVNGHAAAAVPAGAAGADGEHAARGSDADAARSGRRAHRLPDGDARARPRCRGRTRHRLIKRVEILGGLQQRLPTEMSARVSQEMEALTRVKTLSGIVDRLIAAGANGKAVSVPAAVPAPGTGRACRAKK